MATDLANAILSILVDKEHQRQLFLPGRESADFPVFLRTVSLSTTSTLSGCYALLCRDLDPPSLPQNITVYIDDIMLITAPGSREYKVP